MPTAIGKVEAMFCSLFISIFLFLPLFLYLFSVEREVGVHSMVEVSWEIQAFKNSINNTFETFSQAFGVLVFDSGEAKKSIDLKVSILVVVHTQYLTIQ